MTPSRRGYFLGLVASLLLSVGSSAAFAAKAAPAARVRSIREWAVCDGKTDDALAVAKAFAACQNHAFTLRIDGPVFMHVGMDIARPIFVDNGTHVEFTKKGLFITDNVLLPAFVIANSHDIEFDGLRVEYTGGLPSDSHVGGFYDNGTWTPRGGYAQPAFLFNDKTLTSWLQANRGITFPRSPRVSSPWAGPTSTSAMFLLIGSTQNVNFNDVVLFAPHAAGADKFIPMAFTFNQGYDSNQTASAPVQNQWSDVPHVSVPSHLHFSNVTLDGYDMGFSGVLQNTTFRRIFGRRYGDLQDAHGGSVGGVGKWFAPPHLFYLKYVDSQRPFDPRLSVRNVDITDVQDLGPRIGVARDRAGDTTSGYADSLKFGGVESRISHYVSDRPDGLADILSCDHVTLNHVVGRYDSAFLNDLYPGIRFPAGPMEYLTLNDVSLTDTSANPYGTAGLPGTLPGGAGDVPISGNNVPTNTRIIFKNVTVHLKKWARPYRLQPQFNGTDNHTDIKFIIGHPN